jgi:hypothetical protein
MTPEATAIAATSMHTEDKVSAGATLQTIEQRTRAIAEVAEGLRPLIACAHQAPAFVAVLMDSFDEAMRTAKDKGIDGAAPPATAGVLGLLKALGQRFLVVAPGVVQQWAKIPGLVESVGKPGTGVTSNYSYETVASTWEAIRSFRGGTALFTEPLTPVKCGGAPQKIMYLAAEPVETFPVDQRAERFSMYALKAYLLPRLYWHGMLRGRA